MMAMVITMNEIATRLYQAITEKGISYGELARLTAIPKSAIQRYATGTTDKIPLERLRALAAALCLPLSALTGWEEKHDYEHAFRMGVATGSASAFSDYLATREEVMDVYSRLG